MAALIAIGSSLAPIFVVLFVTLTQIIFLQTPTDPATALALVPSPRLSYLLLLLLFAFRALCAVFLARKADAKGERWWFWGGLTLLSAAFGLLLWLLWSHFGRDGREPTTPHSEAQRAGPDGEMVRLPRAESFSHRLKRWLSDPRSPLVMIALLFGTRFIGTIIAYPVLILASIFPAAQDAAIFSSGAALEAVLLLPKSILVITVYENMTMIALVFLVIRRARTLQWSDLPMLCDGAALDRRDLLVGLVAGALIFLTMGVLTTWGSVGADSQAGVTLSMAGLVVATILVLSGLFALLLRLGLRGRSYSSLERIHKIRALILWSGGIALALVLMVAFGLVFPHSVQQIPAPDTVLQFVPLAIAVVLIAPIFEELFFRGYILEAMRRRSGRTAAYLFSAALFAIVHYQLQALVPIFITGCVFAHIVFQTKHIGGAMVAHAVNNGLAFLVLVLVLA